MLYQLKLVWFCTSLVVCYSIPATSQYPIGYLSSYGIIYCNFLALVFSQEIVLVALHFPIVFLAQHSNRVLD